MAITRCPYCRAIIDEKDKFCTNCGTQLLYAEDAEVEEDIPGEKITHADVEEKDYTIPEPKGEESGDVIIRDEEPGETTFLEAEEGDAEEERASGKEAPEEEAEEEEKEEAKEDKEAEEVEETAETTGEGQEFRELGSVLVADMAEEDKEEPADREPFLFSPRPQDAEPIKKAPAPAQKEPETKAEPAPPAPKAGKDMTFDTEELNRIGPTVDLAHRQVEEFLKVLKEEEEAAAPRRAVPPPPAETKDTRSVDTGLPPWVKEMRKASADERAETLGRPDQEPEEAEEEAEEEEREEELRAEEESEAERVFAAVQAHEESAELETAATDELKRTDSGVGLPEKTQAGLPFGTPATAEAIEGEAPAGRRPGVFEDERAVALPGARPPFHLGSFLKAKAFDILFLAAIWLVCLWLAAGRLNGTIFELFNVASDALFAFGGILLVLYFFLFYFFLGETLGDRLFRDWGEDEAED